MAEGDEKADSQAISVDMEAMIEEILARKGPQKYQDGLSEDNWEQVVTPDSVTLNSLLLASINYQYLACQIACIDVRLTPSIIF